MKKLLDFFYILLILFVIVVLSVQYAKSQTIKKFAGPVVYDQNPVIENYTFADYSSIYITEAGDTSYSTYSGSQILADDFVVPTGDTWTVSSLVIQGRNADDTAKLNDISVVFYNNDNGKPGSVFMAFDSLDFVYYGDPFDDKVTDFMAVFPSAISFTEGTYWFSFIYVSQYTNKFYGQIYLNPDLDTINNIAQFKKLTGDNTEQWVSIKDEYPYREYSNIAFSLHNAVNNDFALIGINSPVTGINMTNAEDISVTVYNAGLNSQSELVLRYQVNNLPWEYDTINFFTPIASGAKLDYIFSTPADLSQQGDYTIVAEVVYAGDEFADNNSAQLSGTNYGEEYRISDFNNDTLVACSGTFTDMGGIFDNTSSNTEFTTLLMADDPSARVRLNFSEFSVGWAGVLEIYDGSSVNAPLLGAWSYTDLSGIIKATNQDGTLTIHYTQGGGGADGWIAEISCYTPADDDFSVSGTKTSAEYIFTNDTINIYVDAKNIGATQQAKDVILNINGENFDTINTGILQVGFDTTLTYNWMPQTDGLFQVYVMLPDDSGDLPDNIDSLDVRVFSENAIFESFEEETFPPLFWETGNSWKRASTNQAPDGNFVAKLQGTNDTLSTPRLNIKVGDVLWVYVNVDDFASGYITYGWYDDNNEFHDFDFGVYYGYGFNRWEIDLSEAAGIHRLAFCGQAIVSIDKIAGPELYFDDYDIEVLGFETSPTAITDSNIQFSLDIRNLGGVNLSPSDYTIDLMRQGNPDFLLETYQGEVLSHLQQKTIHFNHIFEQEEAVPVFVSVNLNNDSSPENNNSEIANIDVYGTDDQIVNTGDQQNLSDKMPIAVKYNYSASEVIYLEEQIGKVGSIAGLSYYYNFAKNQNDFDIQIWMGTTDSVSLLNGWINSTELIQVFNSTVDIPSGEHELYFPLQNEYSYNGGNLVVLVNTSIPDANSTNDYFYATDTSGYRVRYKTSLSIPIDTENLSGGGKKEMFPNTTFYMNTEIGILSGTLVDEDGNPLNNAIVQLDGFEHHFTYTDTSGYFNIEDITVNKEYNISIETTEYETYLASFVMNKVDYNLDTIVVSSLHYPVNLIAEPGAGQVTITWEAFSSQAEEVNIYTDNLLETYYAPDPETNMWAGNKIIVDGPGTLTGVAIFAVSDPLGGENEEVTLEILDETFKVIAVSQPFNLVPMDHVYANIPPITYTSDFYIMVHWNNQSSYTYGLGLDTSGPDKIGYYGNPVDGYIEANGTFSIVTKTISNAKNKISVINKGIIGYNIYRGMNDDLENIDQWDKLNIQPISVIDGLGSFTDENWPPFDDGKYVYAAQTIYSSDSSEFILSNTLKYGLESNITLNITSNGAYPEAAVISLTNQNGYAIYKYVEWLGENGQVNFPVVEKGTYTLSVNKEGYQPYTDENFIVFIDEFAVDINLEEIIEAPFNVFVDTAYTNHSVLVSWNGYNAATQLIIDDGTYENGIVFNPNVDAGMGNLFQTNTYGTIESVDLYGLELTIAQNFPVTLDIYDNNQELIATSNSFVLPANDWVTVDFENPVMYTGDFYAIVHWQDVDGFTNVLGLDVDGPHVDEYINYFANADGFYNIGLIDTELKGAFAIRPNIKKEGFNTGSGQQKMADNNDYNPLPFTYTRANVNGSAKIKSEKAYQSFNIYLDNMLNPLASNVSDLYFELTAIEEGDHTVGVSANYVSGESEITQLDFSVHFVGVNQLNSFKTRIYPNPATDYLFVKGLKGSVLNIYSLDGELLLNRVLLQNRTKLNIKNLNDGLYLIELITDGRTSQMKFLVSKK